MSKTKTQVKGVFFSFTHRDRDQRNQYRGQDPQYVQLGVRVRRVIDDYGYTREQAAGEMGISPGTLKQLIDGTYIAGPSANTMAAVSEWMHKKLAIIDA